MTACCCCVALSDPQSAIWVAYSGQAAIGCILFHRLARFGRAEEIKRLYVRPGYRGRGVARKLLDTSERFAQEHEISWLYLDTKNDLTDAIAFIDHAKGALQPGTIHRDE